MIQELLEYSRSRGLNPESGFRPKAVRWAIQIGGDGTYRGIVELGNSGNKANKGLLITKAPDLQQGELIAGGRTRSHFLIEASSVVLCTDIKLTQKHRYFVQQFSEIAEEIPDFAPVAKFFNAMDQGIVLNDAQALRVAPGDKVTVALNGRILAAEDCWHEWWRQRYQRLHAVAPDGLNAIDLATGNWGPIAQTHLKVSGLVGVGGAPTGDTLVSFDKPAFESYGLKQGFNAPMSPTTVANYRAALDELIQRGETLGKVRMVYWYREPVQDQDDLLAAVFKGIEMDEDVSRLQAEGHAQDMLRSLTTRSVGAVVDPGNAFYALLLSGVSGRVMVRGWYQDTFGEIRTHVLQWFDDVTVMAQGTPPPFWRIVADFGRPDVPSTLVRALWEAAVFGRPIPSQALQRALARVKSNVISGERIPKGMYGIIQGYVRREWRKEGIMMSREKGLDTNHPSVAYQCGRLLAMLADTQRTASGDLNASVVTRFYSAASTTPAIAFPQMLRLVRHHLDKIEPRPRRNWFANQITEIIEHIPAFPKILGLPDQGLFALGYFHQLGTKSIRREDNVATDNQSL